ncbi:hypothetical protein [Granulicella pectinivorans]|uniref:hypothetical protein n=1 Tax=Granulicella pectinivorans TaxID=474950 RepID=UPI000B7D6766|nr:hypothetical protein [Granulicella pectinivorans]
MTTRTIGDRLYAIGSLLLFASLLHRANLLPARESRGWFWTAVAGGVIWLAGLSLRWLAKRQHPKLAVEPTPTPGITPQISG